MSRQTSSSTAHSRSSSFTQTLRKHDVQLKDGDELTWDPKSSDHPRNWTPFIKTEVNFIISWLEFYMTAISSSGTATANSAREEYGISRTLAYFAFVTMYLLGQTIGGIVCSPISEVFGRRTVYVVGTGAFLIGSIITAAPPSVIAVYFGRFIQGLAASIPATVAFGNFNDMHDAHVRIWVVYGYTVAGMSGLVLGPIFSAYVTHAIGWRWVYWISAIVSAASLMLCVFMKESNADQLLQAKVKAVRKETGQTSLKPEDAEKHKFNLNDFLQNALLRPAWMLVSEPLVFFCAALCGIAFGLIYGLTEGLTVAYTAPPFNFSDTSASLSFIAIMIGLFLDVFPRVYDDYLLKKYRKTSRRILPETKITSFAIACPALAIGLWIFGWTVPPRVTNVPWPVSMIGLVCIGFAANDFSYVLFGYVSDSYGQYAASAAGAISMTRGLMAAVFPLFTYQMFTGLGTNIAATILAAAATAFCFTPWLFLNYGAQLRQRSKLASDDKECLEDENKHLENQDEEMKDLSKRESDDAGSAS